MRETTITLLLIRHGATRGNLAKRYIGARTDEPLCDDGVRALESAAARRLFKPGGAPLFVSPMIRCRQTAAILFPGVSYDVVDDLRETDFGEFDGLSYAELSGDPRYQRWIDSGGTIAFPGGEAPDVFAARSRRALDAILRRVTAGAENASADAESACAPLSVAIVAHGGNIMAMMSALTGRGFYEFQLPPSAGYRIELHVAPDRFPESVAAPGNNAPSVPDHDDEPDADTSEAVADADAGAFPGVRLLRYERLDAPLTKNENVTTNITHDDVGECQ